MRKKLMVTGAAGMLGRKLTPVLAADHEVFATDVEDGAGIRGVDITSLKAVREAVAGERPDVVVHGAAFTRVDDCESRQDVAFRVNALGTRNVAIAAREAGAAVFYVSTDYVFDGEKEIDDSYTEYDDTGPLSVYGRSKLAGEQYVRDLCDRWYIGRIQWLYGEGGASFADTILRLSTERKRLEVVDDQWGCPTYTGDVARQVKALVESEEYGLYHMSAQGSTSWYGFARALLEAQGRGGYQVDPVPTERFPRPAPRPKNSVLRNLNLELTIGDSMRPWEAGVEDYMAQRGS